MDFIDPVSGKAQTCTPPSPQPAKVYVATWTTFTNDHNDTTSVDAFFSKCEYAKEFLAKHMINKLHEYDMDKIKKEFPQDVDEETGKVEFKDRSYLELAIMLEYLPQTCEWHIREQELDTQRVQPSHKKKKVKRGE